MIISRTPHSGHALAREILARSSATEWHDAKLEWALSSIFFSGPDDPGTCLCGHFPIREHCVLTNRNTGAKVVVGNVCVKRFLGLDYGDLFAALRKIMKNREAALPLKPVDYGWEQGWLTSWERNFCLNTCRKSRRRLSPNQLKKRIEINTKFIGRLTEWEGPGHA
jgi:hypothetical protein